jgi:hypothetical protein
MSVDVDVGVGVEVGNGIWVDAGVGDGTGVSVAGSSSSAGLGVILEMDTPPTGPQAVSRRAANNVRPAILKLKFFMKSPYSVDISIES